MSLEPAVYKRRRVLPRRRKNAVNTADATRMREPGRYVPKGNLRAPTHRRSNTAPRILLDMDTYDMALFDAWRRAEQAASAAELALSSALLRSSSRQALPPDEDQINDVNRMRALADHEHCKALAEMHNRVRGPGAGHPQSAQPSRSA